MYLRRRNFRQNFCHLKRITVRYLQYWLRYWTWNYFFRIWIFKLTWKKKQIYSIENRNNSFICNMKQSRKPKNSILINVFTKLQANKLFTSQHRKWNSQWNFVNSPFSSKSLCVKSKRVLKKSSIVCIQLNIIDRLYQDNRKHSVKSVQYKICTPLTKFIPYQY